MNNDEQYKRSIFEIVQPIAQNYDLSSKIADVLVTNGVKDSYLEFNLLVDEWRKMIYAQFRKEIEATRRAEISERSLKLACASLIRHGVEKEYACEVFFLQKAEKEVDEEIKAAIKVGDRVMVTEVSGKQWKGTVENISEYRPPEKRYLVDLDWDRKWCVYVGYTQIKLLEDENE